MAVEPVWLKEIKCPACDNVFKTPRIRATALKVKSADSDFHKTYEGLRPLLYAITSCPACNYSARNDDFDKVTLEYHKEIIDLARVIKESKKAVAFPQVPAIDTGNAVKKHLLAITFYKHFKPENPNTIAGLHMHIAWIYREEGNSEKETEYLKHALEYYIKTYEKGLQIPEKIGEPGISYLIGEINRRLGDRNEAVKWFAKTIQHDLIGNFPHVENLARDAWEGITEEKRKEKNIT